jgi:hypothetical protein
MAAMVALLETSLTSKPALLVALVALVVQAETQCVLHRQER